jgi:chorismate synthase
MPLTAVIENSDTRSPDYNNIKNVPRPGHSDFTAYVKYKGFNDIRGGGAFSGRLTAPLVFAGALAEGVLSQKNVKIVSHIKSAGDIEDDSLDNMNYDVNQVKAILLNRIPMISEEASALTEKALNDIRMNLDSFGSTIETAVYNLPVGVGQPGFESLESKLAQICFGVPAVKGIEFGKGFELSRMKGSEANDPFYYDDRIVKTRTNNMGGLLGGITNGMPLTFTVCIKPTSSISRSQESVDLVEKVGAELQINGRHDPCIGIRAVPVIEACAALAVLDSIMEA